ncbi:hypothetical protein [Absidia glauca]|uniref:CCHC-type domain-containing protein n=1 Tax=Absidia glauca TaxID=4829 RepID=A0A163LQW6_ABSGL|nr:hypothetical protein [Absidia glauca]
MELDMVDEQESHDVLETSHQDLTPEPTKRAPLTVEERQRRITHRLCLYCGKPGHIVYNCPSRPTRPKPHSIAATSGNAEDLIQRKTHLLVSYP